MLLSVAHAKIAQRWSPNCLKCQHFWSLHIVKRTTVADDYKVRVKSSFYQWWLSYVNGQWTEKGFGNNTNGLGQCKRRHLSYFSCYDIENSIDFACDCGDIWTIIFKTEAHQNLSLKYHVRRAAQRFGNVVNWKPTCQKAGHFKFGRYFCTKEARKRKMNFFILGFFFLGYRNWSTIGLYAPNNYYLKSTHFVLF